MSLLVAGWLAVGAPLPSGESARRHAAALASLGPHPWGSPRAQAAAHYVAAQFRAIGLREVRREPFESHGIAGANVVGVVPGRGPEWIAVGAHHDTAPGSPGAYDDGGGVGVIIEVARVLAGKAPPTRTIVFVSWDGEESWSRGTITTAGSRAFLRAADRDLRQMAAAFDVEMCGFARGRPVIHPIAYPDPLRPGGYVIAPAWVVRAALRGSADAGQPFGVGDPLLSWLYQPAVRTFRAQLYGDDLSFLQARQPALFASDSSFTSFYPWYHQPSDTADKLDAAALARMATAVLGTVEMLARARRGPAEEPQWFAAGGHVLDGPWLLLMGGASLVPGLLAAVSSGGRALALGLARVALFGVLLWRHPVPALWVFLLPTLLAGRVSAGLTTMAYLPGLALAGLGVAAYLRGMVRGLWLAPWELLVTIVLIGASAAGVRRSPR